MKPGQLLTIKGDVYRVVKGIFACYYCERCNGLFKPKSCTLCKSRIPLHMFPLHIAMNLINGKPVMNTKYFSEWQRRKEALEWFISGFWPTSVRK